MQWKVDFMSFGKYLLKLKQNSRKAPAMFGRHAWLPHNKDGGRRDPATNPCAHLFGLEIGGIRKDTQNIFYFICDRRPRPALRKIHIYLKRFRTKHKNDSNNGPRLWRFSGQLCFFLSTAYLCPSARSRSRCSK